MAGQFRAPTRTFEAASAIAQNIRVKVDADGRVSIAGAADSDVGTAARPAFAAGEHIGVNLASLEGTSLYIAGVAVTAGDKVYGAASGKINKTDTGTPIGIALFDAAIDAQVEVLRRQI